MSYFLHKFCATAFNQRFDHLVSCLSVADIDFDFYKLVIIERALKLRLDALSEPLAAYSDDGIEFVRDRAVLLKKSVVQGEALVK